MTQSPQQSPAPKPPRRWIGPAILLLSALAVVLLGLLAVSILERRWESQRPQVVVQPLAQWEGDNAVWGRNYPREYESYARTRIENTRTKFGGSYQRDYLQADPRQVILFAGYPFSIDYKQARGHWWAVNDVSQTHRVKKPFQAGTCWTCKSTDVPRLMATMGTAEFYAANFHDLAKDIQHPIGCQDCHDPATLNLRITRPALLEALGVLEAPPFTPAPRGEPATQPAGGAAATQPPAATTSAQAPPSQSDSSRFAVEGLYHGRFTHQEMRSLVCAQCHVEYYFRPQPKNYLAFPWKKGTTVEAIIEYYDEYDFTDWKHPISGTPILKAQHPDYELYTTGVHAYRGVACADCHMPYRSEGGVKFTDHHVQSPLLNIANSCSVCHRWSEQEIRTRVEAIQTKVYNAKLAAEDALVPAHLDLAAAVQARVSEADLAGPRKMLRGAQFRWDFISANNGMGFHSPQESMRVLGDAANQAQQVRVAVARLLAAKGISAQPAYPDISTREQAAAIAQSFVEGKAPRLLP